jgi:hypothetical protein
MFPFTQLILRPYIDEIIVEQHCGFRRNRSTTDQILFIRQILEKIEVQWDSVLAIQEGI